MKSKSIILLSGGLDSAVNFKKAVDDTDVKLALTFDYGQESSIHEVEAASAMAAKHGVPHRTIKLDILAELDTGLTKGNIPDFDASKLDSMDYSLKTAKAVWVPNRNGLFINIAGAFADKMDLDAIVVGFNKEEGATFPDNTPEYLERAEAALAYSTQAKPKMLCWTIAMDKKEIVEFGRSINAPFEYLWSCYHNGSRLCGKCESCRRLNRALESAGYRAEFNRINKWGGLL